MATERVRALAALAVVAAVAGCTTTNKCRGDTMLLTVTLDSAAAAADTLEIDIVLDGATKTSTVAHAAGSTSGTIEVRFPAGYPAGKSADITVVALQGGGALGMAETSIVLPKGCANAAVSVNGGTVVEDLAGVVQDFAGVTLDLTTPNDLTGSTDIAMCPNTVEDCFNGVDDNCDGLVDCADPQCTGGATPQAECVPDPGSATAGTLSTTTCPSAYPTPKPLGAGLAAGTCSAGSCACQSGTNPASPTCQGTVDSQGSTQLSCNNIGTNIWNHTSADGCVSLGPLNSGTYYWVSAKPLNATCFAPSGGTPMKNAPTFATNDNFCSGSVVGGGCAGGKICVPKAANHCVLLPGSQVACSVAGYGVQNTTPFFSGFDDSARSCACSCSLQGSCSTVLVMGTSTCNIAVTSACQNSLSYAVAKVNPPSGVACAPGATSSGSTSTAGFEETVCCTN